MSENLFTVAIEAAPINLPNRRKFRMMDKQIPAF